MSKYLTAIHHPSGTRQRQTNDDSVIWALRAHICNKDARPSTDMVLGTKDKGRSWDTSSTQDIKIIKTKGTPSSPTELRSSFQARVLGDRYLRLKTQVAPNKNTCAQERAGERAESSCSHFPKWAVRATCANPEQGCHSLQCTRGPSLSQELPRQTPRASCSWETDFLCSYYTKIKHPATPFNKTLAFSTNLLAAGCLPC